MRGSKTNFNDNRSDVIKFYFAKIDPWCGTRGIFKSYRVNDLVRRVGLRLN